MGLAAISVGLPPLRVTASPSDSVSTRNVDCHTVMVRFVTSNGPLVSRAAGARPPAEPTALLESSRASYRRRELTISRRLLGESYIPVGTRQSSEETAVRAPIL